MPDQFGQVIRTHWDQPLEVDFDYQVDMLRESIRARAPAKTGALRAAFNDPQTVQMTDDRKAIIVQVMPGPAARYARIQDRGGYVPPYNIRTAPPSPYLMRPRASVMRAVIGGVLRFFTKRRGFYLRGFDYVYKGVQDWFAELNKITGQPVVKWRSKHYAEPTETRGAISK